MEDKITISIKEYKTLLEASVRIKVFADFVKSSKYSIDREDCGRFFEFDVAKDEEE